MNSIRHKRLSPGVLLTLFALMFTLTLGCGGPKTARDTGPSCEQVANHLLELANRDNQGSADPALSRGIVGESVRQCSDDGWSVARRTCLLNAPTQDDTLRCPAQ